MYVENLLFDFYLDALVKDTREETNLSQIFICQGVLARSSDARLHHPDLRASAITILRQVRVGSVARLRDDRPYQLPTPHFTRETPTSHR